MRSQSVDADVQDHADPLEYAYHPRLGGSGSHFVLEQRHLVWSVGTRRMDLPLADIREVRLLFSPAKFASSSYETRLRLKDGRKVSIGSVSRTSLTATTDQGPAYAAFVGALHCAIGEAGGQPAFRGGLSPLRWWVMVVLGALATLGLIAVLVHALVTQAFAFAGILAVLGAAVVWPTAEMLWRNQPVTYQPDHLPERLMPR